MTELYTRLSAIIPTRGLTESEKETIILQISQLNYDQAVTVFHLINEDFLTYSASPGETVLPYGSKQLKKGVKFNDLNELPVRLCQILRRYLVEIFDNESEEEYSDDDDDNYL